MACPSISFCPSTTSITLTCEIDGNSSGIEWTITDGSGEQVWSLAICNNQQSMTSNGFTANISCVLSKDGNQSIQSNITLEAEAEFEGYDIQCGNQTTSSRTSCVLTVTGAVDCLEDSTQQVPTQSSTTPSLQSCMVMSR